ncbi:thioredoxin domain-containing protein [Hoeflea prorocentri]|uniref:Thioredoxin domain-containing protein n=1 Tax=Hoeflea prorocentri TaxID=1922333 RepID=A0A9X3ZJJ8_9HYPH|nr:thioredoxin domain-containing protein [Hoeflea prorocentri]MCY6383173.1 thioredoxin domain-containing protein [Hoeflea prorocentri]MDA5400973.1 thioredoxin domain-containing protein [Hoeflea prorocentri]
MSSSELTNVLGQSASPYLRQHEDNPVHWQTWGEAALKEAKRTGKPILLSIGYAACHWCHVMAHESFEDEETAALMNELYINIKVDREERTDIDQIYMAALHAMGEQGGWPLTIFLNPEGEPFWGGTYFPKTAAHGRPDFKTVLKSLSRIYHEEPGKIESNTQSIHNHLKQQLAFEGTAEQPDPDSLQRQAAGVLSIVDRKNGGIGQAPKFPNASMLETLWRDWRRSGSQAARDAALKWITVLSNGGIYDHLGGGLARYCVDAIWLVPHFEKMLYDNGQFIRALLWAYGETGDALFRRRIEETTDWLMREMRLPGGGFASSLDADSEGEEGRFYIWQKVEIDAALGDDAALFCQYYDVSEGGNWEGKVILNRLQTPQADGPTEKRLRACRDKLLEMRASRIRPGLDDKVLADWNGLMIRALAEAGNRLGRPDWVDLAVGAFDFVSESMSREGRLAHAWCKGSVTYPALASDYGAMINAAISLYEATLEPSYLAIAEAWLSTLDRHYSDGAGGYYFTADDADDVLLRARHEHDDAAPSASAQILEAMARLSGLSADLDLPQKVSAFSASLWGRIRQIPMAASGTINAIDTVANPKNLVLLNPAKEILDVVHRHTDPSRIDLVARTEDEVRDLIGGATGFDSGKQKGTAAFLCNGPVCLPPVFDAKSLEELLRPPAG